MPRKPRSSAAGKVEDAREGKAQEKNASHGAKKQEGKACSKTPQGAMGKVAGARMGGVKHSGLLAKDAESRSVTNPNIVSQSNIC